MARFDAASVQPLTVRHALTIPAWNRVIEGHQGSEGYFFSDGAMEFFDSKLIGAPVSPPNSDDVYFITSEQFHGFATGDTMPRQYSIRKWNPADPRNVDTISEDPYDSADDAVAARNFVAGI